MTIVKQLLSLLVCNPLVGVAHIVPPAHCAIMCNLHSCVVTSVHHNSCTLLFKFDLVLPRLSMSRAFGEHFSAFNNYANTVQITNVIILL